MSQALFAKITKALDNLDAAISGVAVARSVCTQRSEWLTLRMSAYREVVRRQRILAHDLSKAAERRDYREVSRIGNLIQASSIMIKTDLGQILKSAA